MTTPLRTVGWKRALAAATLALTACGGAAAAPSDTKPKDVLELSVVLPTAAVVGAHVPLAIQLGYFQQVGLNVHLTEGVGGNTSSLVVSGQADIGYFGTPTVVNLAKQGKPTTVVMGGAGLGLAAMLMGSTKNNITTLDALKAKSGSCSIATLTPGSSNYGWAAYYNKTLNLNCKLVPFTVDQEQDAAVATGRTDASSGVYDSHASGVVAGKEAVLIDSRDPAQRKKYLPPAFTEVDYWGLSDNVKSKREAVQRFVKGLDMVNHAYQTMKPADLAAALHKNPDFQAVTIDALTEQFQNDRQYVFPEKGYITEANWTTGLQQEASWGLANFSPADPDFAYKARVDMSYYEKAIGKPKS